MVTNELVRLPRVVRFELSHPAHPGACHWPVPAGSKRMVPTAQGMRIVDTTTHRGKRYRKDLQTAARAAWPHPPLDGPLALSVHFSIPRPQIHMIGQSWVALRQDAPQYHQHAPDTTKLLRAVEDALTGIIYTDDAQIVRQQATKTYSPNRHGYLLVRVESLDAPA